VLPRLRSALMHDGAGNVLAAPTGRPIWQRIVTYLKRFPAVLTPASPLARPDSQRDEPAPFSGAGCGPVVGDGRPNSCHYQKLPVRPARLRTVVAERTFVAPHGREIRCCPLGTACERGVRYAPLQTKFLHCSEMHSRSLLPGFRLTQNGGQVSAGTSEQGDWTARSLFPCPVACPGSRFLHCPCHEIARRCPASCSP
jgi:hypothetical protein